VIVRVLGDIRVLHDDAVDELENDFGPQLGTRLLFSSGDKTEIEDRLDLILAS
jgi:hypothetical protein